MSTAFLTDRQEMEAMFRRAGIVFTAEEIPDGSSSLTIYAMNGPNQQGYTGFHTEFVFDALGALQSMGVWE